MNKENLFNGLNETSLVKINNIIDKISDSSSVIIFGSGEHTFKLIDYTHIYNKNIIGIVDTFNYGFKVKNFNVYNSEEILSLNPDVIVISSYKYENEIFNYIRTKLKYNKEIVKLYDESDYCPFYYYKGESQERVCHYNQLFINHCGDVFPCCGVWGNDKMKIGHITDEDLANKLKKFNESCYCKKYTLIQADEDQKMNYENINIEFSLFCQAKCIMCCVNAPDWKGDYSCYEELKKIIELFSPNTITVQGGEVLVQKDAIEWLLKIKSEFKDIKISIVTNGNVSKNMIPLVEELFDGDVIISINGFQETTYETIMMLPLKNVMDFSEKLLSGNKVNLNLKYLLSPINIHEIPLFLEWCFSIGTPKITINCTDIFGYININTKDDYWVKIFKRTSNKIKNLLIDNKNSIVNVKIFIDTTAAEIFDLNDKFLNENNLLETIIINW